MTETQGFVAGVLLLIAVFVYTFWPENSFASQRQKTRLDYLLERKDQLYENLRDLNFEFKAGKYPEEDFRPSASSLKTRRHGCWPRLNICSRHETKRSAYQEDFFEDEIDTDCFSHRCPEPFVDGVVAQAQITGTVTDKTTSSRRGRYRGAGGRANRHGRGG